MMLSLFLLMSIYGFNPAQATIGDLTISIAEIGQIIELEKEIPVIVTLSNKGSEALTGELSACKSITSLSHVIVVKCLAQSLDVVGEYSSNWDKSHDVPD